jgi:hypothetical protein
VRIHSDQAAAAAIIAAAAATFAYTFTFAEVPLAFRQGMGPERYPQLVIAVIVVLCLILIVQARGKPDEEVPPIDRAALLACGGAVAFMLAVPLVGMIVAMGLALFGLGVLWGERRWLPLILNSVLLPIGIWLLFVRGLKVVLPPSLLGRLLGM